MRWVVDAVPLHRPTFLIVILLNSDEQVAVRARCARRLAGFAAAVGLKSGLGVASFWGTHFLFVFSRFEFSFFWNLCPAWIGGGDLFCE
jgi:hypothetical protein